MSPVRAACAAARQRTAQAPILARARPQPTVCLILTTCANADDALRLGRSLVDARLAACASALPPMTSIYRWQGQVEQASEVQLVVKTTRACQAQAMAHIRTHHPYEVPEILVLPVNDGLPAYLAWVADNTLKDC